MLWRRSPSATFDEQQSIDRDSNTPSLLTPMENIEIHLKTEGAWWVIQG